MRQIANFYQVSDLLATAGQPSPQDFTEIAKAGYEVVVNLVLPHDATSIADESGFVTEQGMSYIHIPVNLFAPHIEAVPLFFDVMQILQHRKTFLHCAFNKRVSAFYYLYQKYILQAPEEKARFPMDKVWQPPEVWQIFFKEVENWQTGR
jgi:protein tyrosine phosphatase (PTP) superfamily phosphohydrolase (DUF442 family)